MNRLLLEENEVDTAGEARLSDHRASHIQGVLRGRPGMLLRAGLVNGAPGTAEILVLEAGSVRLRFKPSAVQPERRFPPLDLLLALPRTKAFKRLLPQLGAMGVRRIMVTNAERVERCYFSSRWLTPTYFRPLLLEGASQGGLTRLPEVSLFRSFAEALRADQEDPAPLTRWCGMPGLTPTRQLPGQDEDIAGVRVAIGPEGGWRKTESDRLAEIGYLPVCLGPRTLRSDTACLVLLGLAMHRLNGRS